MTIFSSPAVFSFAALKLGSRRDKTHCDRSEVLEQIGNRLRDDDGVRFHIKTLPERCNPLDRGYLP